MNEISQNQQIDVLPRGSLTDEQYKVASGFVANWNRTRETILEMAKLAKQIEAMPLRERRAVKAHLEKHAKISSSVLSRLAKVGGNSVLMHNDHVPLLPASYNTLYELAKNAEKHGDDTLSHAIKSGQVTPKLMRKDVDGVFAAKGKSQAEKDAEIRAKNKAAKPSVRLTLKGNFANVPTGKFQAFIDACDDLAKCGVIVGRNEANKVG